MQTAIAIIGIVLAFIAIILGWPEIKKYVPFLPHPLIRISYQESDNGKSASIVFENIGNAKANYFTAEIKTKENKGHFVVNKVHGDFKIKTSGKSGNWTVISAQDILPQQKGFVSLSSEYGPTNLEPPKIKSDSRYEFVGTITITVGKPQSVD